MEKTNTVIIDDNPGRNSQTYGIARELGTDINLIVSETGLSKSDAETLVKFHKK